MYRSPQTRTTSQRADARAHARAQHDGNFQNISAHYYVDDGDTAYQAAPHSRGCWHVGINYGGKSMFQQYGNKNSIGVEMCVQAGYNYEKAFENTAVLVPGDHAGDGDSAGKSLSSL